MSDQMINIIIEATFLLGAALAYYLWQKKRIIKQDKFTILEKTNDFIENLIDHNENQYEVLIPELKIALEKQDLLKVESTLVSTPIHLPHELDELREDLIIHIESHKHL